MTKKVYFYPGKSSGNSVAVVRGVPIIRELKKMGFCDGEVISFGDIGRLRKVKNSIIIIMKQILQSNLLIDLLNNNNVLIYDICDQVSLRFNLLQERGFHRQWLKDYFNKFNGLICPNHYVVELIMGIGYCGNLTVIHHHCDEKFQWREHKKLCIGYIGLLGNSEFTDLVRNMDKDRIYNGHAAEVSNYSCHFSIRGSRTGVWPIFEGHGRKPMYWDALTKPNSKLATAVAVGANIITTMDQSVMELLPKNYPYLTGSSRKEVEETIHFVRKSFGGHEWKMGLKMIRSLKSELSLENIVQKYIVFLSNFA